MGTRPGRRPELLLLDLLQEQSHGAVEDVRKPGPKLRASRKKSSAVKVILEPR
jgi:hypothetical protein